MLTQSLAIDAHIDIDFYIVQLENFKSRDSYKVVHFADFVSFIAETRIEQEDP